MICTSVPSLIIVESEDTHNTPSRQLTATCTGLVNLTINELNITCNNYTTNMKIYYTCTLILHSRAGRYTDIPIFS